MSENNKILLIFIIGRIFMEIIFL
ncbi:hypothetical protein II5_01872, partial [Bacillus cereus MSX-A1]